MQNTVTTFINEASQIYLIPLWLNCKGELIIKSMGNMVLPLQDLDITVIPFLEEKVTVYLIATKDETIKGYLLDYWE